MKNTHINLLSAVIATLISTAAMAENHKFEVQVGAGRNFFEEPLHDSSVVNLGLGYVINKNWTLEAVASDYDTWNTNTNNTIGDVDARQYRLDALYNIDTTSLWRPYVAFGVGDQKLEFNNNAPSTRETIANLGAGIKHSLGGNWEFRTDVRAFNSLDNEYTDIAVNASIGYLFGSAPKAIAPVAVAPAPVAAPKPEVKEVELTETVSITLAVKFDTDKAIVKDQFLADIGDLATFMGKYANTVVTVEGHTDSQGSDAYNQVLSQKRAEAVKQVLITKFNIGADRVTAVGFGEAKPVADNNTAAGREQNRRVVGAVSTDVKRKKAVQ